MAKKKGVAPPMTPEQLAVYNRGFRDGVEASKRHTAHGRRQLKEALKALDADPPLPRAGTKLTLETKLDNPAVGLSKQVYRPLMREGVTTLAQLVAASDDDLLVIRGLGVSRVQEIDKVLGRFKLVRRK